jgi:hypothetical protein
MEETVAFDFFHAFEQLIAYAGESISKNLTEYIRCHQIAETTKAHIRMLSALAPHLDLSSAIKSKLQTAQGKTCGHLKGVEIKRDTYRAACWQQGYDVDELDGALESSVVEDQLYDTDSVVYQETESKQVQMGWWEVLRRVGSQTWLMKKDRVNSWLLQGLAAHPEEGDI